LRDIELPICGFQMSSEPALRAHAARRRARGATCRRATPRCHTEAAVARKARHPSCSTMFDHKIEIYARTLPRHRRPKEERYRDPAHLEAAHVSSITASSSKAGELQQRVNRGGNAGDVAKACAAGSAPQAHEEAVEGGERKRKKDTDIRHRGRFFLNIYIIHSRDYTERRFEGWRHVMQCKRGAEVFFNALFFLFPALHAEVCSWRVDPVPFFGRRPAQNEQRTQSKRRAMLIC